MKFLNSVQDRFFQCMLDHEQNTFAVAIFRYALVIFAIIKIILIWSVSSEINNFITFVSSPSVIVKVLFSPAYWANTHVEFFYSICIVLLIAILFIKWNYLSGIVFFLLSLNLFRLNLSISNGSDYVLFMLSFWTIGMSVWHVRSNANLNLILTLTFNVSVLLCQLQIAFIYLDSGWDKLASEVWRSGDSINYITHLDYSFNQHLIGLLNNAIVNRTLSWTTIVFELAFGILVWFNRTRLITLLIGVVFHLIIWIVLSIPDFALIMMLSYLIFLKDSDYNRIRKMITVKPL